MFSKFTMGSDTYQYVNSLACYASNSILPNYSQLKCARVTADGADPSCFHGTLKHH